MLKIRRPGIQNKSKHQQWGQMHVPLSPIQPNWILFPNALFDSDFLRLRQHTVYLHGFAHAKAQLLRWGFLGRGGEENLEVQLEADGGMVDDEEEESEEDAVWPEPKLWGNSSGRAGSSCRTSSPNACTTFHHGGGALRQLLRRRRWAQGQCTIS
eukprot:gene1940-1199_t